jgi:hypothetical protein
MPSEAPTTDQAPAQPVPSELESTPEQPVPSAPEATDREDADTGASNGVPSGEIAGATQMGDGEPQDDSGFYYAWEASEYIFHEKPTGWYLGMWGIIAVLCVGLGLLRQWLSIGVIVVMALAVAIYSRRPPRTLHYQITDTGIGIDGKISPFSNFKSYGVLEEVGWHEVDLEPARRFMPRLTLICESDDIPVIDEALAQHLPRVDREPDFIERASRYLRF